MRLVASLAGVPVLPAGEYTKPALYVIEANNGVANPTVTTVNVTVADAPLASPQGNNLTATLGVPWSGVVGSFVDPDPNARASYFAASVIYGDSATADTTASVARDPNGPTAGSSPARTSLWPMARSVRTCRSPT